MDQLVQGDDHFRVGLVECFGSEGPPDHRTSTYHLDGHAASTLAGSWYLSQVPFLVGLVRLWNAGGIRARMSRRIPLQKLCGVFSCALATCPGVEHWDLTVFLDCWF